MDGIIYAPDKVALGKTPNDFNNSNSVGSYINDEDNINASDPQLLGYSNYMRNTKSRDNHLLAKKTTGKITSVDFSTQLSH